MIEQGAVAECKGYVVESYQGHDVFRVGRILRMRW